MDFRTVDFALRGAAPAYPIQIPRRVARNFVEPKIAQNSPGSVLVARASRLAVHAKVQKHAARMGCVKGLLALAKTMFSDAWTRRTKGKAGGPLPSSQV